MEGRMFRNPGKLINESIQLQCPICRQQYDEESNLPMIICRNQHHMCLSCLDEFFRQSNEQDCPFCKIAVTRNQATRFRLLHQIKATARVLRAEGSRVRVAIDTLSQDKQQLQLELLREKQKNGFLIQHTIQREAIAQFKFEEKLAKQKQQFQSKIQGLQNQLDLLRRKKQQQDKVKPEIQNGKAFYILYVELPPNQTRLDFKDRFAKVVDVSRCPLLKSLLLKNNQLTAIDLSKCPNLVQLDLNWNHITQLNLLHNPNITYISLYDNHLTTVTIQYSDKLSVKNISLGNQHSNECIVELHYRKEHQLKCSQLKMELESQFSGDNGADYKKHINAYNCQYVFQMKEQ